MQKKQEQNYLLHDNAMPILLAILTLFHIVWLFLYFFQFIWVGNKTIQKL